MHGQYTHSNEHWACFRLSMCGISKFSPIRVIPKRPSNDSRLVRHFSKLINCASLIYYNFDMRDRLFSQLQQVSAASMCIVKVNNDWNCACRLGKW